MAYFRFSVYATTHLGNFIWNGHLYITMQKISPRLLEDDCLVQPNLIDIKWSKKKGEMVHKVQVVGLFWSVAKGTGIASQMGSKQLQQELYYHYHEFGEVIEDTHTHGKTTNLGKQT